MTTAFEKWLREARRYSRYIWCYEDLVDEHKIVSAEAFTRGQDVYEFIEQLGEKYDLTRCDQDWGINSDVKFKKGVNA